MPATVAPETGRELAFTVKVVFTVAPLAGELTLITSLVVEVAEVVLVVPPDLRFAAPAADGSKRFRRPNAAQTTATFTGPVGRRKIDFLTCSNGGFLRVESESCDRPMSNWHNSPVRAWRELGGPVHTRSYCAVLRPTSPVKWCELRVVATRSLESLRRKPSRRV